MPKKVFRMSQFHGGLNTNSSQRDIQDHELYLATDAIVNKVGTIHVMENNTEHESAVTLPNIPMFNGSGFYAFEHDRKVDSYEISTTDDHGITANLWVSNSISPSTSGSVGYVYNTVGYDEEGGEDKKTFTVSRHHIDLDNDWVGGNSIYYADSIDSSTWTLIASETTVSTVVHKTPFDGESYLAIVNSSNNHVYIWDKTTGHWRSKSPVAESDTGVFSLGSSTGSVSPAFYHVDGVLRVSDGGFGELNDNRWYGYINSKLYQNSAGVVKHLISKWSSSKQKLLSLEDLGVDIILADCNIRNPCNGAMSNTETENSLTIGYWTTKGGEWRGKYFIGVTPIYVGGQEGPISVPTKFDDGEGTNTNSIADGEGTFRLYDEALNIQVFVNMMTQDEESALSDNSSHLLNDDRIIGFNLYTKSFTGKDWYLLQKVDLIEGGNLGWSDYDTDDYQTGFLTGSQTLQFKSGDELDMDSGTTYDKYEKATAHFTVNMGGTGLGQSLNEDGILVDRSGFLRVTGFLVSPVYGEVNLNSTSDQEINIADVILPTAGERTFVLEVLDENYNILFTKQKTLTILTGDNISAPDYDPRDDRGSVS